jgi:hypothetical protein
MTVAGFPPKFAVIFVPPPALITAMTSILFDPEPAVNGVEKEFTPELVKSQMGVPSTAGPA